MSRCAGDQYSRRAWIQLANALYNGDPFHAGAAYITSKHAVLGLMKHLAFSYKDNNIRVNTVSPCAIATSILENAMIKWPDRDPMHADGIEMFVNKGCNTLGQGIMGDPENIADAICFLISDEAKFICGAELTVDGGTIDSKIKDILADQIVHDHKEFVRLLRRQYCGRFIQYQDIGIPVERLYNFNPLLGADGQVADNSVRVYFNIVLAAEIADPPRDGAPVQDCQFPRACVPEVVDSCPNIMFSVTVSGGTSMKCW